jgi:hypothetical protein
MTPDEIRSLEASLPLALKRSQVVQVFRRCGLGGVDEYNRLKSTGTLKPLRGLQGAKQARYGKEHVLTVCSAALNASPST